MLAFLYESAAVIYRGSDNLSLLCSKDAEVALLKMGVPDSSPVYDNIALDVDAYSQGAVPPANMAKIIRRHFVEESSREVKTKVAQILEKAKGEVVNMDLELLSQQVLAWQATAASLNEAPKDLAELARGYFRHWH